MPERGLGKRLLQFLAWLIGGWIALSILTVLTLRWVDPPTSAFMIAASLDARMSGDSKYRTRYHWVDYRQISRYAGLAVIASEDQKFIDHWGFDLQAIDESIRQHQRGKRLRGASTITQQVAKNMFLWKGQSFWRKGLEAWFTILIESLWPKQRVLEVYLNIAEFGRGVYGVGAASEYFFRKSPARLSAPESALLAAVLPNPRRFKVNAPSRYVASRQEWILWQMRALGGRAFVSAVEQ